MNSASVPPVAWETGVAIPPAIAAGAVETSHLASDSNPWRTVVKPRPWKHIVLHHTASKSGSVESIHRTHLQRKDSAGRPWLGIGYHFVIGNGNGMADGEIQPTFRWKKQLHGAHAGVGEYNQRGIGIVLVGNFEEHPPTPAQLKSARRLVRTLRNEYDIDLRHIVGHGEVNATACPGKYFSIDRITSGTEANTLLSSTAPNRSFNTAVTQEAQ